MMRGKLILIFGGSRSGKSEFAEKVAVALGGSVTYIATAGVRDGEMEERVRLHRERRPKSWKTVEEEKNILEALRKGREGDVFLLDCATLWLTNLLLDESIPEPGAKPGQKEAYIMEHAARLSDMVETGAHLIIVSNEVGLGLIPDNSLGRVFRDVAGKVNQLLASKANEVYFTIAGIPLEIKSLAVRKWSE